MIADGADLIRLVDRLEGAADGYLALLTVTAALGTSGVELAERARSENVLLVDYRARVDPETGALEPWTVCRLNRQHPRVKAVLGAADG